MNADVAIELTTDDDLLAVEPYLDDGKGNGFFPRTDMRKNVIRSWKQHHQQAINELDRRLRARRDTAEPFRFGQLSPRSQANLKDAQRNLALHYVFMAADRPGDDFYLRKARWYWDRADSIVLAEQAQLDYDLNNDGSLTDDEKNQPFPARVIRG